MLDYHFLNNNWHFPIFVLIGFGIIDTLFKKLATLNFIPFTTLLFYIFFGALLVSLVILFVKIIVKKEKIRITNSYWGIGVGILNFGNILFYLKAIKHIFLSKEIQIAKAVIYY
mgnify:CR=1 FL=1